MNSTAHEILKAVNERGELPLSEAIALGKGRTNDHRDQYALSLLVEDEYLGVTLDLHAQPLERP